MKKLKIASLVLIFCAAVLPAQVAFTVSGNIPTAQFATIEAWRMLQFAAPQPSITLSSGITAGATSLTVSAVPAGWSAGLAANIPATCTQAISSTYPLNLYFATDSGAVSTCIATNTWAAFGSSIKIDNESMKVTAFSGTTLTVVRAQGQTSAATHATGATVLVLQYPTAILLAKQIIRDGVSAILLAQQDATIAAAQAAAASSAAAVSATAAASVQ